MGVKQKKMSLFVSSVNILVLLSQDLLLSFGLVIFARGV